MAEKKQKIRLLLVEDSVERHEKFRAWTPPHIKLVEAHDAGKALGILERTEDDEYAGIMLDYNLHKRVTVMDPRAPTPKGDKVVLALVRKKLMGVSVLVHSTNEKGGPRMEKLLRGADYDVTRIRFTDLTEERYLAWVKDACAGLE